MARKRRLFFHLLYSLLRRFTVRQLRRRVLLVLVCSTLLLVLAGTPVVSQHQDSQLASSPEQWFQRGQIAYNQQEYSAAAAELTRAIQAFETQGKPSEQAIALGNLSLTYQALGQWQEAKDAIESGLKLLQVDRAQFANGSVPNISNQQLAILAALLDIDGQLWLKQGESDRALTSWRVAMEIYQQRQDNQGLISNQTRQLQALHSLGLYGQAGAIATDLDNNLSQLDNPLLKVRALRSLGDTYRTIGQLKESENRLAESFAKAQQLAVPSQQEEISATLLSLGNTQFALGNREKERQISINRQGILPWRCLPHTELPEEAKHEYTLAAETYRTALRQVPNISQQVAIQLNLFDVLLELGDPGIATQQQWTAISGALSAKDFTNRFGVYARIKLAKQGTCFKQLSASESLQWEPIIGHLKQASVIANAIDDEIAISQALGSLGSLYEYFDWLDERPEVALPKQTKNTVWHRAALELTEQALLVAQPHEFPDVAYQWQWQLARLHRSSGQLDRAVSDYRQAVTTLDSIRSDLLIIDSEVQFSFRDNVEPIYRELVDLLLLPENPSQDALREAVRQVDALQLAELESFLQCNLATAQIDRDAIDTTAVNLYGILLQDRIEIILARNSEAGESEPELERRRYYIQQDQLEAKLNQLGRYLKSPSRTNDIKREAGDLYDWLLRPFEAQLDPDSSIENSSVQTLAFVLDSSLRNIPMSVLFDRQRERYLLERYAIATVPSLTVVQPEPLSRSMRILLGGTSKPVAHPLRSGTLPPLQNVEAELNVIQELFPSDTLLNDDFVYPALENKLTSETFTVVHLATHGEFSSDPERTFIMLSNSESSGKEPGEALYAKEIDSLLRASGGQEGIKLLVLSACQTATGDKRATLGLAGLTVRAGSRSTLATLWSVNDDSAATLMEQFYRALKRNPEISKAKALRSAQLSLWKIGANQNRNWHFPSHWAPYVIVGNWL